MTEKFQRLPIEKQEAILNAALIEFADKGYSHASTNQIVSHAKIGKGMLFYYFGDKQHLYYYLIDYSLDILITQFLDKIDTSINDIIERLSHIAQIKFQYFLEYPEVNKFLGSIVLTESNGLPSDLQEKFTKTYRIAEEKVYGNRTAPEEAFRSDIDPNKASELIEWAIKGYQNDLLQKLQAKPPEKLDFQALWHNFKEYLDILRICFYRRSDK